MRSGFDATQLGGEHLRLLERTHPPARIDDHVVADAVAGRAQPGDELAVSGVVLRLVGGDPADALGARALCLHGPERRQHRGACPGQERPALHRAIVHFAP
jgi:hypothetical protein